MSIHESRPRPPISGREERPSGGVPRDEPEQGTPPIVIRHDADDRKPGAKNETDSRIDEASEESFPASDAPAWSAAEHDRYHEILENFVPPK